MKRESVLEKLNSFKDGADASEILDWIMNENGADINREKGKAKAANDEKKGLQEQIEALQAKVDDFTASSMTSEEQLAKAKSDYEEKLRDLNRQRNMLDSRSLLEGAGLSSDESQKLLERFVTDDAAATNDMVAALVDVLDSRGKAVEAATKQSLMESTPKPSTNQGDSRSSYQKQFDDASARGDGVAMAAAIRNGFMQNASAE